MRGILFRTDEEGNVLEKPEVKVSAVRGNNIKVYANQEAKNAALENGDIKPGDVVLSGGEQYGSGCNPIWDEAYEMPASEIVAKVSAGWVAPSDGFIFGKFCMANTPTPLAKFTLNGVQVGAGRTGPTSADQWYRPADVSLPVNKGDVFKGESYTSDDVAMIFFTFVPRR